MFRERKFNSPETIDENYKILSRTTYAPGDTSTIQWRRQGNVAIGTFASGAHARAFIFDHLNADSTMDNKAFCAFNDETNQRRFGALKSSDQSTGNSLQATFNLSSPVDALFYLEGPVEIAMALNAFNTADLRSIIDSEPENHNTIARNNEKYRLLTSIEWSGVCTDKIQWQRDGQVAIGTFGYCEDASGFIHGYLDFGFQASCFLMRETEESRTHRGRLREKFLGKESMVDQVDMPSRKPWGVSVDVKIPLRILDIHGLEERVARDSRHKNTAEIQPAKLKHP